MVHSDILGSQDSREAIQYFNFIKPQNKQEEIKSPILTEKFAFEGNYADVIKMKMQIKRIL